ncbi:MAG: hypothetical protein HY680_03625 [Chloroflexi bacterium]|nr:hypothetical protein [Chloroflexota bacterium]
MIIKAGGGAENVLWKVQENRVDVKKDALFFGTYLAPSAVIDLYQGEILVGALYGQQVNIKERAMGTGKTAVGLLLLLLT